MPQILCALLCFLLSFSGAVRAATVTYDFNLTWVTSNPDGAFDRPTIGINGKWPLPIINVTLGDRVIINVENQLQNRSSTLHFHGLFMNGSTQYDGPAGVSQCSMPPGHSITYDFTVRQPGTYWYHSHADGQYPDGLRGAMIVHDPDSPFRASADEEMVLTLSDWYHEQMAELIPAFVNVANPTGAEPVPNAALMNDTQNLQIDVQPGKTYMFHIINMAAFAAQYLWFEGHTMSVIEVDGVYTKPMETDMLYITAAQRYTILVTMKKTASGNFPIVGAMDTDLFDTIPDGLNTNVTGWLVYEPKQPLPAPSLIDDFEPLDDFTLTPYDDLALFEDVDYSMVLNFHMSDLGDGANYAFINNSSYVSPKVPTLYTALSTGANATNLGIYGTNTNAYLLEKDQIVEIILNSDDPGKHPFHLHGHNFQAVWRGADGDGAYAYNETLSATPMRRDTFMVNPNSNIVLRFRADNPGIWLFHCHIEWHIDTGLVATMIEAPIALQAQNLTIPSDHLELCDAQGLPTKGNAVGNTVDLLDLTGENLPPGPLPAGFTARGIVALVFSCISALLGLAVVSWYGVGEYKGDKKSRNKPSGGGGGSGSGSRHAGL